LVAFYSRNFVELRNDYIGHGVAVTEGTYTKLLPSVLGRLEELGKLLGELRPRSLLVPVEFDWADENNVRYVFRILEGPFAVFPTTIVESPLKLLKRRVYLGDLLEPADAMRWLDLDPIVQFANCPTCGRDDIFFFERRDHNEIQFRSFISGHETKAVLGSAG